MDKEANTIFSKYLLEQLTEAEKLAFEQRLASDADFKAAFLEHKAAMIAGQRIHHNEIRTSVSSIIQQERSKNRTLKIRRMIGPIAAVFLLAIVALFLLNPDPEPDALFAEYYEDPSYSPSRNVSDTIDYLELSKASYAKKEWNEAINNIEKLDSSRKAQSETQKILAHALLNGGREVEAVPVFKQLIRNTTPTTSLDLEWYLGLSYLKAENIDSSLVYFTKILNGSEESLHYKEAKSLTSKIQKLKK